MTTTAGSHLQKVKAGDPLRIPARTYNAFIDAALDHQRRQSAANIERPAVNTASSHSGNVVMVRNDSGQDRLRFEVLGIDAPMFLPADNLQSFQDQIALIGVAPVAVDHAQRFVITAEPIAMGSIGRAWVSGVCPVQVQVDDEAFFFAELIDNNAIMLKAASSGPVTILWKDAGTGPDPLWALVRFGSASAAGLFPVKVWRDGGTTDGDKNVPCNRTYRVRAITAIGPDDENAALLGEQMVPVKKRPARGKLVTPLDTTSGGAGVVGLGYYDATGFVLFDANETLDVEAC